MNYPCPIRIQCGDYPFVNLSSEGLEPLWVPPHGVYWKASDYCCDGTLKQAFSSVSQTDANNSLAQVLATACPNCNDGLQFCANASCPDGSSLTTICVPTSQADADAIAANEQTAMDPFCADKSTLYTATCACPDGVTDSHTVYSNVSQAVADAQCAAIQKSCGGNNPYANEIMGCTVHCPDGSHFGYVIAAGTVYGATQVAANALAYALACQGAAANRTCMSSLSPASCCLDASATLTVSVSGAGIYSWAVTSGALPTGMSLGLVNSQTAIVYGTPTVAGSYAFTLRATNASGSYMEKSFTVHVLGFSTASPLPDGAVGTDYNQTVAGTGGSGNYAYTIVTDPLLTGLPDGLSMDAAGVITGTPTTAGVYTFKVLVQDSSL